MKDPFKRRYLYMMLSIFGAISLSIVVFFLVYRFKGIGDVLKKLSVTLTPDQTEELSGMSTVEEIAAYLSEIV